MGGPTGAQDDGGAALHRGSLLAHGRPVLFNRALRPPTPSSCLADVCVVPPHPTVLRLDLLWVTHTTGRLASVQFKSYDQGRRAFQGTAKQGCWLDEEAPEDVVSECLLRLMTTNGLLMMTFTPLNGLTPYIASYLVEDAVLDTGDGRSRATVADSLGRYVTDLISAWKYRRCRSTKWDQPHPASHRRRSTLVW
jgi:phage terminase large subunit-like protein